MFANHSCNDWWPSGSASKALRSRRSDKGMSCSGFQAMLPSAALCATRESSLGMSARDARNSRGSEKFACLTDSSRMAATADPPTPPSLSTAEKACSTWPVPNEVRTENQR